MTSISCFCLICVGGDEKGPGLGVQFRLKLNLVKLEKKKVLLHPSIGKKFVKVFYGRIVKEQYVRHQKIFEKNKVKVLEDALKEFVLKKQNVN